MTLLSISSDIITCLSFHHISLFITISSIIIIPRSHASSCCYLVTFFLLSSLDSLFRIFFIIFENSTLKGNKDKHTETFQFFNGGSCCSCCSFFSVDTFNHADFIWHFCYCKLKEDFYKHINIALLLL